MKGQIKNIISVLVCRGQAPLYSLHDEWQG